MLSSRAYSVRQKSRLAVSLSWIGGYTNVVAFLFLLARGLSRHRDDNHSFPGN